MYKLKIKYIKDSKSVTKEFERETKQELFDIFKDYKSKYKVFYIKWESINV